MAKQVRFSESERSVQHLAPQNLYRERWTLPLTPISKPILAENVLELQVELLAVRQRFNSGMVYEVGGKLFLLVEHVFAQYPFLLNFSLDPSGDVNFFEPGFMGLPDKVLARVRRVCEQVATTIKLPENLHNVEVDLTGHLSEKLDLPRGWSLAKGIMKLTVKDRLPGVTCDCDVDGPCGYCCDTCDCNSCYDCC